MKTNNKKEQEKYISTFNEAFFKEEKLSIKKHTQHLFDTQAVNVYLLNKKELYSGKNKMKFLVEVSPEKSFSSLPALSLEALLSMLEALEITASNDEFFVKLEELKKFKSNIIKFINQNVELNIEQADSAA